MGEDPLKILFISDNAIYGYGGGCLENKKYYDGLKRYVDENEGEIRVISLDHNLEDSFPTIVKKNRVLDLCARLLGHSTYVYFVWQKNRKMVLAYQPDVIILARSRMGFIAKDLKKALPNCTVVCNMENVEYDYVNAYFSNSSGLLKKLYIILEKRCTYKDEKHAVTYTDALNFLTRRDQIRTHELYDFRRKREMILPICVEHEIFLTRSSEKRNIVFIGSLNYGSNVDALKMFLNEVWKLYFMNQSNLHLIIGGSNPDEQLRQNLEGIENCTLFSNFDSLEDIVPVHSMVIAPIRQGAGMKVKVAESLSMGLVVAASDEALVGYEAAVEQDLLGGILRVNTADEYKQAIDQYVEKTDADLRLIAEQNKNLYHELYSYSVSRKEIARLCDDILNLE